MRLYEPADWLYGILSSAGEIQRLSSLRQMGVLAGGPMEGARLARWDYTAALIYYSEKFKIKKFNSSFNIGSIRFSSTNSALQCVALAWNIGHLPGTFATEKGVYRYLRSVGGESPIDALNWPLEDEKEVKIIKYAANNYIKRYDYIGLSRVLSVNKLLRIAQNNEQLLNFIVTVYSPLLFDYNRVYSVQTEKIRKAFSIIRHVSYLTIDSPFSGYQWNPNIPQMFEHFIQSSVDVESISEKLSEMLSPFEKIIYDDIYHHPECRREVAIRSDMVFRKLAGSTDAADEIERWMKYGLLACPNDVVQREC